MRQGPLAGRYPAVAAMVTLALIPYLALSAALDPLVPIISEQLHMTTQAMSLGSGLGNAAVRVGVGGEQDPVVPARLRVAVVTDPTAARTEMRAVT